MRCPGLAGGHRQYSRPSNPFRWLFLWPWVVSWHKCADKQLNIWEDSFSSWAHFLRTWAALFSLNFHCPSSQWAGSLLGFTSVLPPCSMAQDLSRGWSNPISHLICFLSLWDCCPLLSNLQWLANCCFEYFVRAMVILGGMVTFFLLLHLGWKWKNFKIIVLVNLCVFWDLLI